MDALRSSILLCDRSVLGYNHIAGCDGAFLESALLNWYKHLSLQISLPR